MVEAKDVDDDGGFLSLTTEMSRRLSELARLDEERGAGLVFIHRVSSEARIPTESPPRGNRIRNNLARFGVFLVVAV